MPIENIDSKLEKLEKFSKRSGILKLHTQAHAREILKELNALENEWPIFQKDLDIRLTYAAHYQIWKGLQLLGVGVWGQVLKYNKTYIIFAA